MKPSLLIGLIGSNLIWSAHPAMSKLALGELQAPHFAFLRYGLALLSYALAVVAIRSLRIGNLSRDPQAYFTKPRSGRELFAIASLGFLSFCFSPLFTASGLNASRATDNALIIALEPMMAVLLARIFLKEKLAKGLWVSFVLAVLGFSLLSGITWNRLSGGWDSHLMGNLLLLVSLSGEAAYSVLGKRLVKSRPPAALFGTALLLGVGFLGILSVLLAGLPDLSRLSWSGLGALFWVGVLGTTLTYLYWMHALLHAPVASLSLTLFVQPLAGALWGRLFLDENLTSTQAIGGAMILIAVLGQSLFEIRDARSR